MNGAKQLVDLFRIVVAFERNQAVADHLQMLLRFWLEEFQYLVGHFVIRGQRVEVGAGRGGDDSFLGGRSGGLHIALRRWIIQRRRFRREGKAIAILESSDVIQAFLTCIADLQKIRFEKRNTVRKEFREWSVKVLSEGRVERVLKHVSEFRANFRKTREPVAG